MAATTESKAIIVGDGAIGKTCLLSRITNNAVEWGDDGSAPAYEPTTFNNFKIVWEQEDEDVTRTLELELWDTAGQEGFEQLRTLSYPGTDIFLVGFSCNSTITLNNIEFKWIPEIERCRIDNQEDTDEDGNACAAWIIMVGTKMDIRDGVTKEKEFTVAKSINACALVDTSAKEPDKDMAGISQLEMVIMTLAFMKDNADERPSFGDFGELDDMEGEEGPAPADEPAPAAELRQSKQEKMRQSTGPKPTDTPVAPTQGPTCKDTGTVVKGPEKVEIKPCPPAADNRKPQADAGDAGCQCVIA